MPTKTVQTEQERATGKTSAATFTISLSEDALRLLDARRVLGGYETLQEMLAWDLANMTHDIRDWSDKIVPDDVQDLVKFVSATIDRLGGKVRPLVVSRYRG